MASLSTSSMSVRCDETNSSYEWLTGSVDSETSCMELLRAERWRLEHARHVVELTKLVIGSRS